MPVLRIAQHVVEILDSPVAPAEVSLSVVEILYAMPTASPTTPTGAGISQAVVEVLVAATAQAEMSQIVMEILMSADGSAGGTTGGAGVRVFGYIG